jgi:hypothetical protein
MLWQPNKPTNNQINNKSFVQLSWDAFIQWNGGRSCTPNNNTLTTLSLDGGKLRETFPSLPHHHHRGAKAITWNLPSFLPFFLRQHHGAKGNYAKPLAPSRSKGTYVKPSFQKLYGDFQPWLLCISSGPNVQDPMLGAFPWMGLWHCKAQSEFLL